MCIWQRERLFVWELEADSYRSTSIGRALFSLITSESLGCRSEWVIQMALAQTCVLWMNSDLSIVQSALPTPRCSGSDTTSWLTQISAIYSPLQEPWRTQGMTATRRGSCSSAPCSVKSAKWEANSCSSQLDCANLTQALPLSYVAHWLLTEVNCSLDLTQAPAHEMNQPSEGNVDYRRIMRTPESSRCVTAVSSSLFLIVKVAASQEQAPLFTWRHWWSEAFEVSW